METNNKPAQLTMMVRSARKSIPWLHVNSLGIALLSGSTNSSFLVLGNEWSTAEQKEHTENGLEKHSERHEGQVLICFQGETKGQE